LELLPRYGEKHTSYDNIVCRYVLFGKL